MAIAGIERRLPILGPVEKVRELLEALGKLVEGKAFEDARVRQVGLRNKPVRRREVGLFPPMHRDLRLGDILSMARRVVF
jgi:hypothetical protein